MKTYNLHCYDGRKSFYGKAQIIERDNGVLQLQSYNTIVCELQPGGVFVRLWDGYSATTIRHVNSFLTFAGWPWIGGKKFWDISITGPHTILFTSAIISLKISMIYSFICFNKMLI